LKALIAYFYLFESIPVDYTMKHGIINRRGAEDTERRREDKRIDRD